MAGRDVAALLARLVAGGSLLLAAFFKLKGGPMIFSMSIQSFKIFPEAMAGWAIPATAHFLPWLELILGLCLVLGVWVRESAALAAAVLGAFTLGLVSVIVRGLNVDCGCFGGLFGEAKVTWGSVARNAVFIAVSGAAVFLGPGKVALQREA